MGLLSEMIWHWIEARKGEHQKMLELIGTKEQPHPSHAQLGGIGGAKVRLRKADELHQFGELRFEAVG